MMTIVGVALRQAGRVYYFDAENLKLAVGNKVVVETTRGQEFGEVVSQPGELGAEEQILPLKRVIRVATRDDEAQDKKNHVREREAYKVCQEKIEKHKLPMKLITSEYIFDGSKMIFYFSAEGRVDFRELVKDLASTYRTRIELRQIGVRDEAKLIGGLGPCGRDLCCKMFLNDFEPVSIKMAKEQDLPLNPIKISGICGRLMCCLKYECETYECFKKKAPRYGKVVDTPEGKGKVVGYNVPMERVIVELENARRVEVPLDEANSQGSGVKGQE